jgi:acetate kinase
MTDIVLALNAGSSTVKYALYRMIEGGTEEELAAETLELGSATPASILEQVLGQLAARAPGEPTLIGHRVVHGGALFTAPVIVDQLTLGRLRTLVSLAPLHLPPALDLIEQALKRCSGALHVACFDTAFHRTLPEVARRFALPSELYERGVRRYGFHGLSYEYVLCALGVPCPQRLIIAHLGSGASLAAIRDGRSIDTSMGLTPTGGVPMGTRSGDLDPGVLLHLMREHGYEAGDLERLLNHESGLKGLAGTANMSELVGRERSTPAPALAAIELFSYAIKKQIGAYVAALGGLDCLVFTGGIGEHVPLVRALATSGLEVLGIELDPERNAVSAPIISRGSAPCQVRVVATNEDLMIARAAFALRHSVTAGEHR